MFTADHHRFYREESPFFPLIQEKEEKEKWSNGTLIRLPASLQDDLQWEESIALAEERKREGDVLLWEIDLGLASYSFNPEDSAAFYSFSLAVEQFSKQVFPSFADSTFGVVLYRGGFHPELSFPATHWEPGEDPSLFCARSFAEYLHRLVSFLPESVLPFAMFDLSSIPSAARQAQLFSKEKFEHTHLILKRARFPFFGMTWEEGESAQGWVGKEPVKQGNTAAPSLGLYLPSDEKIDASVLELLDAKISALQKAKTPFRILSEEKLTEQWDGLDTLLVPEKAISQTGKRKLLGFAAAGGELVYF